jgi:hypothetical protein
MLFGLLIGCSVAFACGAIRAAQAHDFWANGEAVDPLTKRYCCGQNDAKRLAREDVRVTRSGYQLSDTGETVPFARTQPSPDGAFWVFRWGGQTQCFFAPVNGA